MLRGQNKAETTLQAGLVVCAFTRPVSPLIRQMVSVSLVNAHDYQIPVIPPGNFR